MLKDELSELQEKYRSLRLSFRDGQAERNELLDCLEVCKKEHKELRVQLEDAQQEAESAKMQLDMVRGELLALRGQVAAYKHCIAAMTGTEMPIEITQKMPENIEW